MNQRTQKPASSKPSKPYDDFPLFPHATRRWAKKIRGRLHYFGPWDDPTAALQKFQEQRDDLFAGRTPRVQGDGLTIRHLLNRFLTAKRHLLDTREIAERTFADYHATCKRIGDCFGLSRLVDDLASDDFEQLRVTLAKNWGPVTLGNEIQRVRVVFKYGYDAGLIEKPMRYGPAFKRPSKKTLRLARNQKGLRMFEAAQIRRMIAAAGIQLRAMILLGVNCGFGNQDVATLPIKSLDLKKGWLDFPRPKTGIQRRCPLWPETIAAISAAIAARPTPKNESDAGLIFITKRGLSWAKDVADSPVSKETTKLLTALKIKRPGLSFYGLRHTFETIAGESRDQVAVNAIMGHAPLANDMASVYRERISDDRLRAVSDFVRKWLFPARGVKNRAATRPRSESENETKVRPE